MATNEDYKLVDRIASVEYLNYEDKNFQKVRELVFLVIPFKKQELNLIYGDIIYYLLDLKVLIVILYGMILLKETIMN